MRVNLNVTARVILTELGAARLNGIEDDPEMYSAGQQYRVTLRELMRDFGQVMLPGLGPYFEDNMIEIEEDRPGLFDPEEPR